MSASALASSGDIVLADEERVYVADGFGGDADGEHNVTAFDARTGEVVWRRSDLAQSDLADDDVFLQALAGDTLVVNGQYHTVTAVDSATGDLFWSFRLPEGYGAVRSAVSDGMLLVGAEAPGEGDVRPPIIYALDLDDGAQLWEAALADGTDLQWHTPPAADGLVFVSSTLSHPRSASGNMIHALDLSTGEVRWVVDLGGDQGFNFYPSFISGELLVSWTPEGFTVAIRITDGSEVWVQPETIPMAVDTDGTIYARGDGIVQLSPTAGSPTTVIDRDTLRATVEGVVVQDDQLIATGRFGAIGFDIQSGEQVWKVNTQAAVAPPAIRSDLVVVAINSGIAVFEIP